MGGPGELSSPLLQLLPASPLCPWGRGLLLALLRAFQSPHCCHFPQERICRFRPVPTAPCSFVQGIISLLSHAAESNFQTVLATLTMFASRLYKGRNARISRRKKVKRYGFPSWHSSALFSQQLLPWEPRCIAGHWGPLSECLKAFLPTQMELDSTRAHATRSALMLAHGSLALRASKEQLLAHLEGDIVGNILMLYSCSCRVRAQNVPGCLSAQLQPLHMGGC